MRRIVYSQSSPLGTWISAGIARWLTPLFTVLLVLGLAAPAHAQPRNAAEHYQRAIERLERMDERDWEAIEAYRADPSVVPPGLREALARANAALSELRRGSLDPYSDFGLDYSQGWDMVLPHLRPMRSLAKLAQADVYLRLHDGDSAGAADRLAALYRYSGHIGSDRTLVSSLVGNAVFRLTDETVQYGVDQAAFDPDASAEMHRALQGMDPVDPFGSVEALVTEQELTISTIENFLESEGDSALAVQKIAGYLSPDGEARFDPRFADIDVDAEINQYDAFMNELIEAFSDPDVDRGREKLETLEQELIDGEHGMLVRMFMPAFIRVHESLNASRQLIENRMAQLEEIAEGRVDPFEEANALHFYLQAFRAWEALPKDDRDAILAFADADYANDEAVRERLASASDVLELLRKGAALRRCDFSRMNENAETRLCPRHAPALHECLALLRSAASLELAEGRVDDGVQRFKTSLEVIGDFGGDGAMLTPVVLNHAFIHLAGLIEQAEASGRIDDDARSALLRGLKSIGVKDPFGWVTSLATQRSKLARLIVFEMLPEEERWNRRKEIETAMNEVDGDGVLLALALLDPSDDAGEQKASLARIDELIDGERLGHARRMGGLVLPALTEGDLAVLRTSDEVEFGRFEEKRLRSRGIIRHLGRVLRPAHEGEAGPGDLREKDEIEP